MFNEEEIKQKGYSVFDSEREFLKDWKESNLKDNSFNSICSIAKVIYKKICTNDNLFIIALDNAKRSYKAFLSPAIAEELTREQKEKAINKIEGITPRTKQRYTKSLEWNINFLEHLTDKMVVMIPSEQKDLYDIIEIFEED